jgi:hypothetical protein
MPASVGSADIGWTMPIHKLVPLPCIPRFSPGLLCAEKIRATRSGVHSKTKAHEGKFQSRFYSALENYDVIMITKFRDPTMHLKQGRQRNRCILLLYGTEKQTTINRVKMLLREISTDV